MTTLEAQLAALPADFRKLLATSASTPND